MTLYEFIGLVEDVLLTFEEDYLKHNSAAPSFYPLELPSGDSGLWFEFFENYVNKSRRNLMNNDTIKTELLAEEIREACQNGASASDVLSMLLRESAPAPVGMTDEESARYEALEREHLGDPDKRTGIYAPQPGWPGDGFMQPPDPPECCGDPMDLEDRIRAAIASSIQSKGEPT